MDEKPNIIFIMPDQLRPDVLSCYDVDYVPIEMRMGQGV